MNRPEQPPIPDHRLFGLIASGAYGEVWLGSNALGTLRAVKIVRRDQHLSLESFEREFKGLQKFEPVSRSHEGLVDILTLGLLTDGSGFYYVMELADDIAAPTGTAPGPCSRVASSLSESYRPRTLRADLKSRGALPAEEVIRLGLKLTAALSHLHGQGLVHRDVKPSNILFVSGEPKLADAGLVAAMDDAQSLVGTAGYIAPEGPGTPQADLYALGKVLYEAAFGKDRQEFPALPADVALRPDHGQLLELNEILATACAHDPRKRYVRAADMQADLELLRTGKSVKQMRAWAWRWNFSKRIGMAAALAGVIVAGVVFMARQLHPNRPLSSDPEAIVLYEQAKGLLNQQTSNSAFLAYEYLDKAVKRDPKFLDAYYMMFESYFSMVGNRLPPHTNRTANFQWVAEEMRKLDDHSAQYHTAVALTKYNEWKWDEAIDHLKLALLANPNFLRARGIYGAVLLRARGDSNASLREFRTAERIAPFDATIQMHLGTPYYVVGDYTNAIAQFRKALALGSRTGGILELLGLAFEANGQYLEALEWYEKDEKSDDVANEAQIEAKYKQWRAILAAEGRHGMWQAQLEDQQRRGRPDSYEMAGLHARLGQNKEALDLLEKAFNEHHQAMNELLVDHYWRPLYDQPRFQEIVKQIGFKPKR